MTAYNRINGSGVRQRPLLTDLLNGSGGSTGWSCPTGGAHVRRSTRRATASTWRCPDPRSSSAPSWPLPSNGATSPRTRSTRWCAACCASASGSAHPPPGWPRPNTPSTVPPSGPCSGSGRRGHDPAAQRWRHPPAAPTTWAAGGDRAEWAPADDPGRRQRPRRAAPPGRAGGAARAVARRRRHRRAGLPHRPDAAAARVRAGRADGRILPRHRARRPPHPHDPIGSGRVQVVGQPGRRRPDAVRVAGIGAIHGLPVRAAPAQPGERRPQPAAGQRRGLHRQLDTPGTGVLLLRGGEHHRHPHARPAGRPNGRRGGGVRLARARLRHRAHRWPRAARRPRRVRPGGGSGSGRRHRHRGRRHQRTLGARGRRPGGAVPARRAGRTGRSGRRRQPAHRRGDQRRRTGLAAVGRPCRGGGVGLVPGTGGRRRPRRRARADNAIPAGGSPPCPCAWRTPRPTPPTPARRGGRLRRGGVRGLPRFDTTDGRPGSRSGTACRTPSSHSGQSACRRPS